MDMATLAKLEEVKQEEGFELEDEATDAFAKASCRWRSSKGRTCRCGGRSVGPTKKAPELYPPPAMC